MPVITKIKVLEAVTNPVDGGEEQVRAGVYDVVHKSSAQWVGETPSGEFLCGLVSVDDPSCHHQVESSTLDRWKTEGKVEILG